VRFPLQGVVQLETITFLTATALQRKLSILLAEVGGFLGSRSRSACSRGLLRPLRGSAFGLGQPDDFVAGASPHGSRTTARGGYPRLIVLTVYGLVPFIVSFHDLRLLRYAFQYADHLVVLNLILLVVPTIPRFESVRIVKLQKFGAIRLSDRLGEFVNTPN